MSLLFVIGVEKYPEQCVVQRLNLDTGDYLMPRIINSGTCSNFAHNVVEMIMKDRPDQVLFDDFGYGIAFSGHIRNLLGRKISVNGIMSY